MTLYNANKNYKVWRGEPIFDIRHSKDIEFLWTNAELEAIGLYKTNPNEPIIPVTPYDPTKDNIINTPDKGFGGPTMKELFDGN